MHTNITTDKVWMYIWAKAKHFPVSIFTMFWMGFIWSISISVEPYLIKVICNLLTEGDQAKVVTPILLYLGMYALLITSYRLYDYWVDIKMVPQLRTEIANDAIETLLSKDHAYYQGNFSGSLANKVNDLTSSIPNILEIIISNFFSHSLALAIAILTLWQVSHFFAWVMFVWSMTFLISALLLSKYLVRRADAWSEFASTITGKMVDVLSNVLSVRLFAAKQVEKKSLNHTLQGAMMAERKLQWGYFWMFFLYGLSFLILQFVNFYYLCEGYRKGWITVGDFALVIMISSSVIGFIWQLAREFSQFAKLYGRVTQALRTLLAEPGQVDSINAKPLVVSHGEITFSHVTFHYKGSKDFFRNQSITLYGGQKVGLVGYSGSGKTTFVNLILRLYEVSDGSILIDGQNIRDVTQDSLCQYIAMIPQDPSLFHRTLLENIRYGHMQATDSEVIEAAKRANAHAFISKLPQGYDSLVGERGVKISGGQRQRIAIARAILKNAPILILDEATSQLDSLTEADIQVSLWELMQGKTTIIIAHRLSTLMQMDRILVFDQGQVVQDGTHAALLRDGGLYKKLWEAQEMGYLPSSKTS